ncbi:restriction endonuclease subunit S [Bifidobacterium bifidum]|nr:restriction endonuclease subunit S [Bifidobacterium bifidum]PVV31858.1 restriction endonuclease subunit S [Bifidobacterium bifidum]
MMAEQAKVPSIRFAGFTDPWEQRKLVDIAEIVGGGTPDTNNSNYWDGDIDWYAPAELGNNIYAESSTRKITQAGFDSCSTKMLPADKTILFTSRAGIGNTAILRHSACTNQGFQSLVIGDADVYFVYSMSERIKKWAEEKASGSTFLEISGRQLETMPVNLPSLVEQQAIGSFFSHLDDLITLHQRKYDKLVIFKKSMLEKMFPKDGESVPEIRFAGFTDPWEQRKLGEVAHFINGRAYSQNELLFSGKYPVLRVGNFYTNDSWYYSDLELEDKSYAYEGDLLYTWSATFGPHIWHGNKVIYHYHIWKVQLEAALEKLFAFQLLERDKERILSDKNGSTMVHITKTGIENTSVLMPCSVEEQRRIGAFFDHLDSIITLHQRKLELLQNIKKSLLDKMFV